MSKWVGGLLLALVMVLVAGPASAELITDGDFENGTAGNNFNVGPQFTYPDTGPFGQWFDVNQWQYVSGGVGGSLYAGHVVDGNHTNLLFQMIDTSGGIGGSQLKLEFDWIYQGGGSNRDVWVVGMNAEPDPNNPFVEKFAPFFPSDNSDNPAGDVLLNLTPSTATNLPVTQTWTNISVTFDAGDAAGYDAIAVMFKVSSSGLEANWPLLRGVDNVSLVAIPEPGTIGLVLLGGAAVAWRRKRRSA